MSRNARTTRIRVAVIAAGAATAAILGAAGHASADITPGTYTSTTSSSGIVLLQRPGHVEGHDLVLIGRYPIHSTPNGGYVDIFPGHRIVYNRDGHGGYSGPVYFGSVVVGTGTLTAHR
ncbi:hypothetical protein ACLQ3C_00840 [Gordonia sp. DT30]|uniref:hypothetical protein n=1 Tax=Gordonia sp. DT30 TaxID=3416546 RepID=UPI003CEE38A9